jgi:hypothetical protein
MTHDMHEHDEMRLVLRPPRLPHSSSSIRDTTPPSRQYSITMRIAASRSCLWRWQPCGVVGRSTGQPKSRLFASAPTPYRYTPRVCLLSPPYFQGWGRSTSQSVGWIQKEEAQLRLTQPRKNKVLIYTYALSIFSTQAVDLQKVRVPVHQNWIELSGSFRRKGICHLSCGKWSCLRVSMPYGSNMKQVCVAWTTWLIIYCASPTFLTQKTNSGVSRVCRESVHRASARWMPSCQIWSQVANWRVSLKKAKALKTKSKRYWDEPDMRVDKNHHRFPLARSDSQI